MVISILLWRQFQNGGLFSDRNIDENSLVEKLLKFVSELV